MTCRRLPFVQRDQVQTVVNACLMQVITSALLCQALIDLWGLLTHALLC